MHVELTKKCKLYKDVDVDVDHNDDNERMDVSDNLCTDASSIRALADVGTSCT